MVIKQEVLADIYISISKSAGNSLKQLAPDMQSFGVGVSCSIDKVIKDFFSEMN